MPGLIPAGPLALVDLIGLDTCQRILTRLRVAAGRLGRKTGAGFHGGDP